MTKNFSELEAKMSLERRAKIAEKVKEALAEMPLNEAMGGELEVIAHFPDGDVRISNFSQI